MNFGAYIRKLREAKRMTQADAARAFGISQQYLNDIEAGRRNFKKEPALSFLKRISAVYDHPLTSLIDNTEFFHYEKTIVLDLFTDFEPALEALASKLRDMSMEARQYTPEMETMVAEANGLLRLLKDAIRLTKKRLRRGENAVVIKAPLTSVEGKE